MEIQPYKRGSVEGIHLVHLLHPQNQTQNRRVIGKVQVQELSHKVSTIIYIYNRTPIHHINYL